jgi:Coenzyme PQQ synthesis protein D (PqqD)
MVASPLAMSRLQTLAINAEGFAFNPMTGECFRLNETAEFVIKSFRLGETVEEVAATIAREYGIPEGRALSDVLEFRTQLARAKLID